SPLPPSSRRLLGQEACQDLCGLLPIPGLALYLLLSSTREAVVLGATIIFGDSPLRSDVPFLLQLEKRRIERSIVHREQIAADLLNSPRDSISVQRAHALQRLEHHQSQRPLLHFLLPH